jgi:hypothetical protein
VLKCAKGKKLTDNLESLLLLLRREGKMLKE